MANEIIKPHRFEVAKNKIQTLAHNVPSTVSLNKFPTEGSIFSWNNHNITGSEANELLVSPLQSTLIAQNSNIRSLFNIADEVYKALESLDKEYIAGIIASIESAKVASGQAKTASTKAEHASMQAFEASQKALEASKKANNAQDDIKKTIEGLKMTVQILKEFKEKVAKDLGVVSSLNTQTASIKNRVQNIEHEEELTKGEIKFLEERIRHIGIKINSISEAAEVLQSIQPYLSSLSHIKDVDTIWNDVENQKTNLAGFHQQVDAFIERVNRTTESIHGDIAALQQYRSMLESFQHLGDIDTIWNDVENQKTNLAGFHQQVDAFIERVNRTTERIHGDIAALQQYRSILESFQHLGDIDTIWNDVENQKTNLAGFHQQVDAFIERVNRTTESMHGDIAALQQYRSILESFQHLGDVDAIWNDVEGHKIDLADFHQQVNNFISEVHAAHDEIKISINNLEDVNTASHVIYEKRIKTAYYVGGTALVLSIINYILQILGVF